jgi:glutaredoxin 3
MTATVEIYTTTYCPYCVRAKELFQKKGVAFTEIDVTDNCTLRGQLVEKANGRKTVPQIFIDGAHFGGCDDLYALDATGQLDMVLKI